MASKELIKAVNEYDKFVAAHKVDETIVSDYYIPAIETAIKGEKDTEYGLALSNRVKGMIDGICKESTGADIFALDSYCNHHQVEAGILNSFYEITDIESPLLFDSYLLSLEKDRKEEDRFYSPKREQLYNQHKLIQDLQNLEDDKLDILSISMPPGTGKGSCMYSKVLTPIGFVEMRDIKVGSKVISGTGNVCNVTGVFPQGLKDIWEVTFDDGAKCRCSGDHLWTVHTKEDILNGAERVIELNEIRKEKKKYLFDYFKPALDEPISTGEFKENFNCKIEELITDIKNKNEIPQWVYLMPFSFKRCLCEYWGNLFMRENSNYYSLRIQNESLAKELQTLVRSMGDGAKLYRSDNGNYELICIKGQSAYRRMAKIEYIGEEECQCIYIDDPSHLYVTDDYIVTHNTTLERFFISWIILKNPTGFNLFMSHSDSITRMFYDDLLDITTNDFVYRWGKLSNGLALEKTDAKNQWINFGEHKTFASLQCTSIASKNAGVVRCNKYLCCDDFIGGIEEALNKNILDKIWRIYAVDSKQRKLNQKVKELHIATRWSTEDVIGRIKELKVGNDRAKFVVVPDINEKTGKSNFEYKYNGMSVSFFNEQALMMDDISYKCLYKGEPIEREGLLYTEDELRRYKELPEREEDAVLGICDVKNKGTDFMFLPVLYQYGDDYYCVDCVCDDNSDYGIQYERLSNLIVDNGMQQCQFESNNGGDRVSYEVDKLVKVKGGVCNITEKATETNKETRILVNADWVKKHILFKDNTLYTPKDDYGIMISWLLRYSVKGKNPHDDVPDGFSIFANLIRNKSTKRETKIYSGIL